MCRVERRASRRIHACRLPSARREEVRPAVRRWPLRGVPRYPMIECPQPHVLALSRSGVSDAASVLDWLRHTVPLHAVKVQRAYDAQQNCVLGRV